MILYDSYIEYTGEFVDYAPINRSSLTFKNNNKLHMYELHSSGVSKILTGYFGQNNEGRHIFASTITNNIFRTDTILAFKCDRGIFYKPFEEIKFLFFNRIINDELDEFYNDLKAQYYRLIKYIINNKLTTPYYLTDIELDNMRGSIDKNELNPIYCYTAPGLALPSSRYDDIADSIKYLSNDYTNVINRSLGFNFANISYRLTNSYNNTKSIEARIKIALLVGKSPIFIDYQDKKVTAYKYRADNYGNIIVNKVFLEDLIHNEGYYYSFSNLVKDITPAQLLINLLGLKGK